MRILTLFLALFLTLLPESVSYVNTTSSIQEVCFEDACDVEQEVVLCFQQRWKKELAAGDPYYNPNLTLEREDFSVGPVVRQHDAR